ncbi:SYF1 [Candida pseudojiufengensis]|uniref:SYF1 n=1 Tax=Candida pseudojiufengensis TaxID=497109 RepID=UPI0022251004|nr:SYF1 [Candida pseudojiufengensis]KAI5965882.1 SYF1 [Candida pseudojiufengensis]
MMNNSNELINDEDLSYEESLLKKPEDESIWKSYYESKINDNFQAKLFIITRAVKFVKSEELWTIYLNLVVESYLLLSQSDIQLIIDECVEAQSKSLNIWIILLKFLTSHIITSITSIRKKFDQSLQSLPVDNHESIWELYLDFADKVEGATAINIYTRVMKFINPKVLNGSEINSNDRLNKNILDFIEKLESFGDKVTVSKLYNQIINSNDYSNLPKSQFQILEDYLEYLINDESTNEKDFIKIINKSITKYPDQISNLKLKLIKFQKSRNSNYEKIKKIFEESINECKTVLDFKEIYNEYVKFEENEIEKYINENEPNLTILYNKLNSFESLLKNRALLINDIKLKSNINNIDFWFQRFDIYKDDLNLLIQTIAQSIKSINPLKIPVGCNHKLKEIWINYSKIYSESKDFKTADFILSKSIQSQFPHPQELIDIYIYWCELKLSNDHFDEDSSIDLLSELLLNIDEDEINDLKNINFKDSQVPVQRRIKKSNLLYDFFIDLLISFIDFENPDSKYLDRLNEVIETIILLKIATPKNLLKYATLLENLNQFEKSLAIYERCLQLFQDNDIQYEIWQIYLTKLKYIDNKERIKDIQERYLNSIKKDD